jgi:hypothetical protein
MQNNLDGNLMVGPTGVEPVTARFVAEYSIQLSHGPIKPVIIARFWQKVKLKMVYFCKSLTSLSSCTILEPLMSKVAP